jgi:hypothetical protein
MFSQRDHKGKQGEWQRITNDCLLMATKGTPRSQFLHRFKLSLPKSTKMNQYKKQKSYFFLHEQLGTPRSSPSNSWLPR